MDSLATLNIPAIGHGIRYEFGMFEQTIQDGWQVERTEKWLELGNSWEIPSTDCQMEVKFGGHTEPYYADWAKSVLANSAGSDESRETVSS